jgi:hypothetical protein
VNLRRGELRYLREVERDIAASEPGLYAFFVSFNRRGAGREMPRTEQTATEPRRLTRRRRRTLTERMKDWCAENWKGP